MIDFGVPLDETKDGSDEVLLLYTLPEFRSPYRHMDPENTTQNCGSSKVILQQSGRKGKRQCIAILPQWESY